MIKYTRDFPLLLPTLAEHARAMTEHARAATKHAHAATEHARAATENAFESVPASTMRRVKPLDYEEKHERPPMGILTLIAVVLIAAALALIVAMWAIALRDHVQLSDPYARHGPFRHHELLNRLFDCAALAALFGVLPMAFIACGIEKSRASIHVLWIALVTVLIVFAHGCLFE